MILMGNSNWYMPKWLDRIVPKISIEGAEFFDQQDRSHEEERAVVAAGAAAGLILTARAATTRQSTTRHGTPARLEKPRRSGASP